MSTPAREYRTHKFDEFVVDCRAGELYRRGKKIKAQLQPMQVLMALLEAPGEIVTREELRQKIWPADTFVDFEHSLNTAIKKLRQALGDSANKSKFVETLPRRGYRFLRAVESSEEKRAAKPAELGGGSKPGAGGGRVRGEQATSGRHFDDVGHKASWTR
jgi:DNA-binding winged helix-turn-helix (wHTH) protein